MDQEEDLTARRGTPRWALLLSWIVAAAVWLWVINVTVVRDRPWSSALANASAEQLGTMALNSLFFVVAATVVAAFAMFLVRLIGLVVAWLKLRFVEGK